MDLEHTSECTRYYSHRVGDAYFYGSLSRGGVFRSIIFRHDGASDAETAQTLDDVVTRAHELGATSVSMRLMDNRAVRMAQMLFGENVTIETEGSKSARVEAVGRLELNLVNPDLAAVWQTK